MSRSKFDYLQIVNLVFYGAFLFIKSFNYKHPWAITRTVRSFLESFEQKLESVSMFEKKELIRMVVEKIVVDREADQMQYYLRALPGI